MRFARRSDELTLNIVQVYEHGARGKCTWPLMSQLSQQRMHCKWTFKPSGGGASGSTIHQYFPSRLVEPIHPRPLYCLNSPCGLCTVHMSMYSSLGDLCGCVKSRSSSQPCSLRLRWCKGLIKLICAVTIAYLGALALSET